MSIEVCGSDHRMRISQIVERFGGTLEGDGSREIAGVKGVEFADASTATFAVDEKLLAQAEASEAGCVIVSDRMRPSSKTLIRCAHPLRYVADLLEFFNPPPAWVPGVAPSAVIGEGAALSEGVQVAAHAVIGRRCKIGDRTRIMAGVVMDDDCEVGEDTVIHPNVTIYCRTRIGSRVLIHAGAVLGTDGFGFFPDRGTLRKWPHTGCVVIEDDVEIGANVCIDRAKYGVTLVQAGSKIDNLVQIAHNCRIGRNVILAGQTGLSGSVVLEDGVTCGGQVGIADHVTVGRGAMVAGQSGVMRDLPEKSMVFGSPAQDRRKAMQDIALLRFLVENRQSLRELLRHASGEQDGL